MSERFNDILSRLRHEKGVSQREAAAELGISQALLSHYENGVREPGLAFLAQACDYYGVSTDYILGRSGCRERLAFTGAQLETAEPYIRAALELAEAVLSLPDADEREKFASLISALICSLSDGGRYGRRGELINALVSLRRAQLEPTLSALGFAPQELLRRTEDELGMLFDEQVDR